MRQKTYIYIHTHFFCSLAVVAHTRYLGEGFLTEMAAPSPIVKLVQSRLTYTQIKVEGPLKEDMGKASKECIIAITASIRKVPSIKLDDASVLQDLVIASVLPELAKKTIIEAVDAKVGLDETLGSGNAKQTLLNPELFQNQHCWETYGSVDSTCDTKLMCMAMRLVDLGGFKLSEPSFAAATAVAMHKEPMDPEALIMRIRQLKTFHGAIDKSCKIQGPPHYTDPETLKETNPMVWEQLEAGGPVTPSQLSKAEAAMRKTLQPCRAPKGQSGFVAGQSMAMQPWAPAAMTMPKAAQKLVQTWKQQWEKDQVMQQWQQQQQYAQHAQQAMQQQWMQPPMPCLKDAPREQPVFTLFNAPPKRPALEPPAPSSSVEPPKSESAPRSSVEPCQIADAPMSSEQPSQSAAAPENKAPEDTLVSKKHSVAENIAKFQAKINSLPLRPTLKEQKAKATTGKVVKNPTTGKVVKNHTKKPAAYVDKPLDKMDSLTWRPQWKSGARLYGCVTIYVDTESKCWRVKPGPGRRDERKVSFASGQNADKWQKVVDHVKSLPQIS